MSLLLLITVNRLKWFSEVFGQNGLTKSNPGPWVRPLTLNCSLQLNVTDQTDIVICKLQESVLYSLCNKVEWRCFCFWNINCHVWNQYHFSSVSHCKWKKKRKAGAWCLPKAWVPLSFLKNQYKVKANWFNKLSWITPQEHRGVVIHCCITNMSNPKRWKIIQYMNFLE